MNRNRHVLLSVLIVMLLIIWLPTAYSSDNDPFEGMRTYYEGQYKVGRDFIAGEYVLLNTSDYSGYFAISSDANGRDTIANGLFEVNSIITVYDGEYLELSRCIAIDADDFYSSYTIRTDRDGTMLKVGYDILPGEYKLIAATGTSGYYSIYVDSRQTNIVDNNLFKNSAWVNVKSGQYVVLSRCHIDANTITNLEQRTDSGSTQKVVSNEFDKVGSLVAFGQYPQGKGRTKKAPIEWIVLDVIGNKCLILSRAVIDAQPFNTSRTDVTWETSTLREWLNNDFIQEAFSMTELAAIQSTHVSNADNEGADWCYASGKDTEDKVFLLSYGECNKYFSSSSDWYTAPTEYAKSKGTYSLLDNEHCSWWLRSKGNSSDTMLDADDVNPDHHVMSRFVDNPGGGIRPALWLDLSVLPR